MMKKKNGKNGNGVSAATKRARAIRRRTSKVSETILKTLKEVRAGYYA